MNIRSVFTSVVFLAGLMPVPPVGAGDPATGAKVFGACAACHSLEPGRHLTGPSLAGVWGRKAGTAEGFTRYSEALRKSSIVWDEKALDAWLTDPQARVPNNLMTFPGIKDARAREDLIAFLRSGDPKTAARGGGMMGMMGPPRPADLRRLTPEERVTAIRYCNGSYYVTTAGGATTPFWEFNLRFKTDASPSGPTKGRPALAGAGMMGDRAFVVFSHPDEMGRFIKSKCQ